MFIISHGMEDDEAFALEAALIPLVGETNAVAGHGDDRMWLQRNQISELYDNPVQRSDIDLFRGNLLFVSLNRQDTVALRSSGAERDLEYLSLGDWNLGESRSRHVDCLVGLKHGLIISIFEIEKTVDGIAKFERIRPKKSGAHGRSRFMGERRYDLEKTLALRSVFEGKEMLSKIRPGAGCQFLAAMNK